MNCEETFPVETETQKSTEQLNHKCLPCSPGSALQTHVWIFLVRVVRRCLHEFQTACGLSMCRRFGILSVLITSYHRILYRILCFSSSCCAWSRISHWQTPFLRSICSNPWPTQRMGKIRDQWHLTPLSTLCNYKPSRERVALPNFTGQLSVPVVESFSVVLLSLLKHFLFSRFTHFAANFYIIVVSFCLQMEGQSQVKANAFARP